MRIIFFFFSVKRCVQIRGMELFMYIPALDGDPLRLHVVITGHLHEELHASGQHVRGGVLRHGQDHGRGSCLSRSEKFEKKVIY